MQRLLGTALAQSSTADSTGEPMSPTSPTGLTNRPTSALPPGLTPHSTTALLSIASMLCDDPPLPAPSSSQQGGAAGSRAGTGTGSTPVDWLALDEAAQKAVRAVQLAVCTTQPVSGTSSIRSSTSFQIHHQHLMLQTALIQHGYQVYINTSCHSRSLRITFPHYNTGTGFRILLSRFFLR